MTSSHSTGSMRAALAPGDGIAALLLGIRRNVNSALLVAGGAEAGWLLLG